MKVALIVLDSVGIGALPDAYLYDDVGSNTVGNIANAISDFCLPNLSKLGLGNIHSNINIPPVENPIGAYGKAKEKSKGKDTTTGHWEICGIELKKPFPTFPDGFPKEIINSFEKAIGTSTIGNVAGSGTKIIEEFGKRHMATGFPIIYTSADSVFQIAMHEEVIPIKEQYEICLKARALLKADFEVGRVIARPFIGEHRNFVRTSNRKDFSVPPPYPTVLNLLKNQGTEVAAVGKINDIFSGSGITQSKKTKDNNNGVQETISLLKQDFDGLIFTNLIDFDMHYGHRRDVEGYAQCLKEFDSKLPELINSLSDDDVLIVTADHGNDPTAPGTDHTREYIPILICGKKIKAGIDLGVRASFSDIGKTILEIFNIESEITKGKSFWKNIYNTRLD